MLKQEAYKRYAAIDIGSNAIRLLVCQRVGRILQKLTLVRLPIRLGSDVFLTGKISSKKQDVLIHGLKGFSSLMKAYEVDEYKACATSAMRDASNSSAIIKKVKEKTGIDLEVIDGKKEADYLFKVGLEQVPEKYKSFLYIDVGGGSTELTFFSNKEIVDSYSFQLGTVRCLLEKDTKREWKKLKKFMLDISSKENVNNVVASGGNINKYLKLADNGSKSKKLNCYQLAELHGALSELSFQERMDQYGLRYDRADVIVPAGRIFLEILSFTQAESIFVPKMGLADGLILEMLSK